MSREVILDKRLLDEYEILSKRWAISEQAQDNK
jgi:hypothetical protein